MSATSLPISTFGPGGEFLGVVGDRTDDADLLAALLDDDEGLDAVADLGARAGRDIGGDDGELDLVEEGGKAVLAVVEFMVADGHGVELHEVEKLGFRRALVGRVEERALEIVAGVEQHVLAGKLLALGIDGGLQARDAAEAFALAFLFGRAGRIELVDRLDARMQVVDMQDVQLVIGECRTAGERDEGGGQKAGSDKRHGPVLLGCRARWRGGHARLPDRPET